MSNISKITLGKVTYDIKDTLAHSRLDTLDAAVSGGMHYIGVTSTKISDGSNTATLAAKTANSLSKTTGFVNGDFVSLDDLEFVWVNGTWHELGSTGTLGTLAKKDSATGSITIPTTTHTHTVDVSHTHTIKQGAVTATGSVTATGNVSITDSASAAKKVGTGSYIVTESDFTPVDITGVSGTTDVYSITNLGSVPTIKEVSVPIVSGVTSSTDTATVTTITNPGNFFEGSVTLDSNGDGTLVLNAVAATTSDTTVVTGVSSSLTSGTAVKVNSVTNVGSVPTRQVVKVPKAATSATTILNYNLNKPTATLASSLSATFTGTSTDVSVSGSTSGITITAYSGNVTSSTPSATETTNVTVQ